MPTHTPLAPQIEQFIHDNPQGVLTSFRRNGMSGGEGEGGVRVWALCRL